MVLRRTCSLWKLDVLAIALTPSSIAILLQANDWTFLYDLEGQLQFPIEAAVTYLRPDVVLFSRSSKTIVLLELTVPLEDNVHQAHDRKTTKYSALVTPCEENGFNTHMFALEVGCLGYCPHSFLHCHSSSSEWLDISVRSRRPATVSNRAAVTSLRPDVVLFSPSSKTIVLLELTVPLEDNVHQAHDRKTTKYSALVTACEENGFKTHMFALEVGCLGYCPHSFLHCHSSSSEWLDISVRSRRPATVSNRSCCNVSKARCGVIFSFEQDNRPPGADSSSRGQCPLSSWQKNNQILCLSHGLRRKWF